MLIRIKTIKADTLFYLCFAVYLIVFASEHTNFENLFPLRIAVAMAGPIALSILPRWRMLLQERKKTVAGAAFFALCVVVYLTNRTGPYKYGKLVLIGLYVAGCVGIPYKKMLKVWVWSVGSFMAVTILAAVTGAIENIVHYAWDQTLEITGTLGNISSTDAGAWIFTFVLFLWLAYENIPLWVMVPLMIMASLLFLFYFHCNTAMVCMAMLFVLGGWDVLMRKQVMGERAGRFADRVLGLLATWSMPLLTALMIGMTYLYGRGNAIALRFDQLIHSRLRYVSPLLSEYGVKAFGSNFSSIGYGGGFVHSSEAYTFIDSSYPSVLLRYGVFCLIAVLLLWMFMARQAVKAKDRRLLIAMLIIAAQAFEEHHLMEITYNPLIILPLASFATVRETQEVSNVPPAESDTAVRKRMPAVLFAIVLAALLCFWCIRSLPLWRTVLDVIALRHGGSAGSWPGFLFCAVIVLAAALAVSGIVFLTKELYRQGRLQKEGLFRKKGVLCCATGVVFFLLHFLFCNITLSQETDALQARMDRERKSMEAILSARTMPVYAMVLPKVYSAEFDGFSDTLYGEDDIFRLRPGTVLTERTHQMGYVMTAMGYLYAELSEDTGVYTKDPAVRASLVSEGIPVRGFFYTEREMTVADALGTEESVVESGAFTATLSLSLEDAGGVTEGAVGTLQASLDGGERVLSAQALDAAAFDAEGNATVTFPFTSPGTRRLKLEVLPADGVRLRLQSVHYAKTPVLDQHTYIDEKTGLAIRRENYDLDGNRTVTSAGVFAEEYEHDENGYVNEYRYFDIEDAPLVFPAGYSVLKRTLNEKGRVLTETYCDAEGESLLVTGGYASFAQTVDEKGLVSDRIYYDLEGNPVLTTSGYAEIHMEYDENNRLIHEEYYGTDGERIVLPAGQSGVDYEYNSEGLLAVYRYLDQENQPVMLPSGYSVLKRSFDDAKRLIRDEYFDTEDQPVLVGGVYHAVTYDYNENGERFVSGKYNIEGEAVE